MVSHNLILQLPCWNILGLWLAAAPPWTWITSDSTNSLVVTPHCEAAPNITRILYLPGCVMVRRLKLAYTLVIFPLRLRTLDVRVPPIPGALAPDSVLNDTLATSCCAEGFAVGRTATTTGRVNGVPGRTALGGGISNMRPYSRLELPVAFLPDMTIVAKLCHLVFLSGSIDLIKGFWADMMFNVDTNKTKWTIW